MSFQVHFQHDMKRGEPQVVVETEEELIEQLKHPQARWARDLETNDIVVLDDGALERSH